MKKFTFIMIALLVASMSFAQTQMAFRSASAKPLVKNFNSSNANTTTSVVRATRDNAIIFSEGFEFSSGDLENGWTSSDEDGDGQDWFVYSASTGPHTGSYAIASASWNSSALTPNNWLISPAIDLTAQSGTIMGSYFIKGQDAGWYQEHYKVCVSTTTNIADFTTLFEETIPQAGFNERSIDLSAYAGQTIYIAFVHYNVTDMFYIVLDDFSVYANQSTDAAVTAITAPNHGDYSTCALTNAEQVKIEIVNNGGAAISNFQVSYAINGGTPVTETVTASVAPAQTYEYTFTQTADFSAVGTYEIAASINLTGDEVAANNNANMTIISGDAKITIHAFTDNGGGQSWTVTNTNTSTLIAERTAPWQWNVEVNNYVCVDNNGCYTIAVYDEDGMVDGAAYLEILYNGTQVAGSTTPDSFTGPSLIAERIGGGCSTDPEIVTDNMNMILAAPLNDTSMVYEAEIRAYNLTETITATTAAPFEISIDNSVWGTTATLPIDGGTLYVRYIATAAGSVNGTIVLSSAGAQDLTINLTGKAADCAVAIAAPYNETFGYESETLYCWSIINANEDDINFSLTEVDGNVVWYIPYATPNDDYIVSPLLTIGANNSISFKVAHYSNNYPETYEVYAIVGDQQTLIRAEATTTTLLPTFETVEVSLADYAGQEIRIAIKCTSNDAYYFFVDDFSLLGTNEANENIAETVAVYPNPTKDMVTVANAEGKNIVIVNSLGQVVANIENAAANQTIDVANFANGTYFVKVDAEVIKLNVVK